VAVDAEALPACSDHRTDERDGPITSIASERAKPTQSVGPISRTVPFGTRMTAWATKPDTMPSVMLSVTGIAIVAMSAGATTSSSPRSTPRSTPIVNGPTSTRAVAVAVAIAGIRPSSGDDGPLPSTRVEAKDASRPMPGARAR